MAHAATTTAGVTSASGIGPMLKVTGLRVAYGGIQAVKGISFEVLTGELVSLIGANGAGKTTTLKSIARLLPLTSGSLAASRVSAWISQRRLASRLPYGTLTVLTATSSPVSTWRAR